MRARYDTLSDMMMGMTVTRKRIGKETKQKLNT